MRDFSSAVGGKDLQMNENDKNVGEISWKLTRTPALCAIWRRCCSSGTKPLEDGLEPAETNRRQSAATITSSNQQYDSHMLECLQLWCGKILVEWRVPPAAHSPTSLPQHFVNTRRPTRAATPQGSFAAETRRKISSSDHSNRGRL